MAIYRTDLLDAACESRSKRLRQFIRKRLAKTWQGYVESRPKLLRMLVRERARGDTFARIERGYCLMAGIRLSDGSLVCHLPRLRPRKERKPSKIERPLYPRLFRFPEGHEREGQLAMLRPSKRTTLTRRVRKPVAQG